MGARLIVRPSSIGWGRFLGRELPPRRLVPQPSSPDFDPELNIGGHTADGKPLTQGDLCGIFREDPEIGYVWAPSRASRHGWWRTNALGARADRETTRAVPRGKRRVLVFGDSFAAGTRLPGESTWAAQLERLRPDLDVVNFGVDGYGMGQSYLLFQRVREQVDWDLALFLFVPGDDAWRDVNVSRWIGDGWASFTPMPRFVLDGSDVRLVRGPYSVGRLVYTRDWPEASPELRAHLARHDRFYDPLLYESPPLVGRLVSFKLLALLVAERRHFVRRGTIDRDLDGEAFTICRRVLSHAEWEAEERGKAFAVAVLPADGDLRGLRTSARARGRWNDIVGRLRGDQSLVVDLAPVLLDAPSGSLDRGADDTHYGPRTSARLAAALARALPKRGHDRSF